jgi:hypothetical protein
MLRADIGAPPEVDACAGDDGAPCYNIGGVDVGGFFFVSGRFDNWTYDTTILDNFNCDPCGCFCFKREGLLKEFACFPDILTVNFELTDGDCSTLDGFSLTLEKGQLSPGDGTQFGPCGAPGQFGYFPFCCPVPAGQDCYTSIPNIKFKITVTE